MGFYYKLKQYEPYLEYTSFDNLKEWFELMKDKAEEPIVQCNGCNKEIKNNPGAREYCGD